VFKILFLNGDVRKLENDFLQEEAKKIRLENVCNSFYFAHIRTLHDCIITAVIYGFGFVVFDASFYFILVYLTCALLSSLANSEDCCNKANKCTTLHVAQIKTVHLDHLKPGVYWMSATFLPY